MESSNRPRQFATKITEQEVAQVSQLVLSLLKGSCARFASENCTLMACQAHWPDGFVAWLPNPKAQLKGQFGNRFGLSKLSLQKSVDLFLRPVFAAALACLNPFSVLGTHRGRSYL